MIVFSEPNHTLPLISASVAFRVGRIHDPSGKEGLSRITARMLRRGCKGYTAEQFEEEIDALGGELGINVGLGSSSVSFEVLKRSLDPLLHLVSALLESPTFDDDELQRLKRQTIAEIVESRGNDSFLAGRAFRRELFAGHPHSARVSGTCESIERIERADVLEFHRRHYHAGNAVVVVSGDVDDDVVAKVARRLTGGLPEGERTAYPDRHPDLAAGRRLVVVDKPERSQSQVVIGTLGTFANDEDHTALLIANTALGGTFTSRLTKAVRSERGWSYVASSQLNIGKVREAFMLWTAPAAEDTGPCISLCLELLESWRDGGITEDELRFCQDHLRRSYAFAIDTAKKRVLQKLERELYGLPDDYHQRFIERVQAVTLDEVNSSLLRRIAPDRLCLSVVATDAQIGDRIRASIPDLASHKVVPFDIE